MLCRHLCGCVTWHGETAQADLFVCGSDRHSASYAPMREGEIVLFFHEACKIFGHAQQLGLWAAKLDQKP